MKISKTDKRICAKAKYYLAKFYLDKNQPVKALNTIEDAISFIKQIGGKGETKIAPRELGEIEKTKDQILNRLPLKGVFYYKPKLTCSGVKFELKSQ